MAEISLAGLTDKEILALQEAINRQKRQKIDWDNMSDQERAFRNKTLEPKTHKESHDEYPKTMYGNVNGQIVAARAVNEGEEELLAEKYPAARWAHSPGEHGLETCPSKPTGANAASFIAIGGAPPPNPAIENTARDDTVAPLPEFAPRKAGRPRKEQATA